MCSVVITSPCSNSQQKMLNHLVLTQLTLSVPSSAMQRGECSSCRYPYQKMVSNQKVCILVLWISAEKQLLGGGGVKQAVSWPWASSHLQNHCMPMVSSKACCVIALSHESKTLHNVFTHILNLVWPYYRNMVFSDHFHCVFLYWQQHTHNFIAIFLIRHLLGKPFGTEIVMRILNWVLVYTLYTLEFLAYATAYIQLIWDAISSDGAICGAKSVCNRTILLFFWSYVLYYCCINLILMSFCILSYIMSCYSGKSNPFSYSCRPIVVHMSQW